MGLRGFVGGWAVVLTTVLVGACSGDDTDKPEETGSPPPAEACIAVEPQALDFGEVELGDPASVTLTISNDCAGALELLNIRLENPRSPFTIADSPAAGTVLAQGGTADVVIDANPPGYGAFSERLLINSDDPDDPVITVDVTLASVCVSVAADVDDDSDGVPNDCDVCAAGDDALDADDDTVPNACDVCPDADDTVDADADTVPDCADACPGEDDRLDDDADTVPNGCDLCPGFNDQIDGDGDTVPDDCDLCSGFDDRDDQDNDGEPDACDICPTGDNGLDADGDLVPDDCDVCPGQDDLADTDTDGVPNCLDLCEGIDDAIDDDGDGVPGDQAGNLLVGSCDVCADIDDAFDFDGDGIPGDDINSLLAGSCDTCAAFDDNIDIDGDGVPGGFLGDGVTPIPGSCDPCNLGVNVDDDGDGVFDACDLCPNFDDAIDVDGDGIPGGLEPDAITPTPGSCDICNLGPNDVDDDLDGVPDACDACANFDDSIDADADGVPGGVEADGITSTPGSCDLCEGFDDGNDADLDTVPDGCDVCAGADDLLDADADTVPDCIDLCPGDDDRVDTDTDTVPDCLDVCPNEDDLLDSDTDTVPDCLDVCPNEDDLLDSDADTVPDCIDLCPNDDDLLDADSDTVPDCVDACAGADDRLDGDNDGIPDTCDLCPGSDDNIDSDADSVPDCIDLCTPGNDNVDVDLDGTPDFCDSCVGVAGTLNLAAPAPPMPRVDVLLVVEDTFAMQPYLASIPAGVGGFVNQMNASGADWQLALITSSSPTFIGPVIPGGPNAAVALNQQFGSYGLSATALTQGIEQAWAATQPGGDAGPNSVFFRADSTLAIVFVTDSPDTSPTTPTVAYNYWLGLKNQDVDQVRVGSIDSAAADPVDALAAITGGPSFDIATANFAAATVSIADFLVGDLSPLTELPTNVVPVPQSLQVTIGGTAAQDWYYDARRHAIVFPDGPSLVGPLDVNYVEDCGGTLGACQDGVDNDNDGVFDFPDEPGCDGPFDSNEDDPLVTPECIDGIDNDGDTLVDWPAEAECDAASDEDEDCFELATDAGGYTMCEITATVPTCPDLSVLTPISLGSFGSAQVPLGFTFDFYGTDYTTVEVGANGTLGFSNSTSPATNTCLPDPALGDAIMLWWDDLDPQSGDVWTRATGTAPFRTFAVHWRAPHVNGFANVDVRAVLHEKTGDIELCYVDTAAGAGLANGSSATAGIQHGTTSFLEYSCNAPGLVEDLTVRFEHP